MTNRRDVSESLPDGSTCLSSLLQVIFGLGNPTALQLNSALSLAATRTCRDEPSSPVRITAGVLTYGETLVVTFCT